MTHFDDEQLAAWLNEGPRHAAPGAADDAVRRAHAAPQRPGWLVTATGGTFADDRGAAMLRFAALLVAVAVLTTLLLGGLVAGGIIKPFPVPSIVAIESQPPGPDPTAGPSLPSRGGLVAFTVQTTLEAGQGSCERAAPIGCHQTRVWVANEDGSEPRELFPRDNADHRALAWTPNGQKLLVDGFGTPTKVGPRESGLRLVDLAGNTQQLSNPYLCDYPCVPELSIGPGAFSPDGNQLAFTRQYPDRDYGSVISILNLRTGQIQELASTFATEPAGGEHCHELTSCEGTADAPAWSPDGRRLLFDRQHMSPDGDSKWTSAALYVVDANGSNLQRITPPGFFAIDPSWSPDGSRITFLNAPWGISRDGTHATDPTLDVYTVRPDGSDLQQLTYDGISGRPDWTTAGRIVFARHLDTTSPDAWIMDADGSHQARILGNILAEMGAAGCQACIYPLDAQSGGPTDALWQPQP
jgi:Tol biopolymer transport system component